MSQQEFMRSGLPLTHRMTHAAQEQDWPGHTGFLGKSAVCTGHSLRSDSQHISSRLGRRLPKMGSQVGT